MMLLDILLDLFINIYTSLGYGTKEHKIESKMEKIKATHPTAYALYVKHQAAFETDELLSEKIVRLNVKNQKAVDTAVHEIYVHFKMVF
ncbi:MAG: hypothetical protein ABS942_06325 [Solibacillus sp.]|uniref:hypothetical protein n=1 Tax=Solibacillus sp. TaxID=1909654 RepID=UPI00331497ED